MVCERSLSIQIFDRLHLRWAFVIAQKFPFECPVIIGSKSLILSNNRLFYLNYGSVEGEAKKITFFCVASENLWANLDGRAMLDVLTCQRDRCVNFEGWCSIPMGQ